MTDIAHLLIYTAPEFSDLPDLSTLAEAGYEVTPISQPKELELWLIPHLHNSALIIAHPSANEGLAYSAEILQTHPHLPIILVSNDISQPLLSRR